MHNVLISLFEWSSLSVYTKCKGVQVSFFRGCFLHFVKNVQCPGDVHILDPLVIIVAHNPLRASRVPVIQINVNTADRS